MDLLAPPGWPGYPSTLGLQTWLGWADRLFLGEDLLSWLLLALGGAMAAGNAMALVRPPNRHDEGDLERAPLWRSLIYIALGVAASLWAVATLAG